MDMIKGLLGQLAPAAGSPLRDPSVQRGLYASSAALGAAGQNGMALGPGIGYAAMAYNKEMQDDQEYRRSLRLQAIRDKSIESITDDDLRLLATLDPDGSTVAQVLAAKLRARTGVDTPMAIKEWNAYQEMSPEDQDRYLRMKRATQYLDVGSGYVGVDPTSGMATVPGPQKGLAPSDLPSVRGAQAGASAAAAEAAKNAATLESDRTRKVITANDALATILEARALLGSDPTSSALGVVRDQALGAVGISTKSADVAAALDVVGGKLVGTVPRFEGPQSDKDTMLYRQMAADVANRAKPVSQRLAALDQLEAINMRYTGPQTGTNVASTARKTAPAVGTVKGGYRFKGGDPSSPNSWEAVR